MEILEFFPDCLLILDPQVQNSDSLYENQKMQEFKPLAKKLVWDPLQKLFVNRDLQQQAPPRPGETVFETESEMIPASETDRAEARLPEEAGARTLWGYIQGNLFQFDRIRV